MSAISQLWQLLSLFLHRSKLSKYGQSHRLAQGEQKSRPWALVTGASDGLGVAWAQELAVEGINVILHGRNQSKLDGIKKELETGFGICVRTLVFDAELMPTSLEAGAYEEFDKMINGVVEDIPLTILINNIGYLGRWISYADRDPLWLDRQLNMNIQFMNQLTRVLIPHLHKNEPSLLITVSSGADNVPMPWSATYSGQKGYTSSFTRTLKYELMLDKMDIEVICMSFGMICTPSTGRTDADATWAEPTARTCARAALNAIGCGYAYVFPYWGHALQGAIALLIPVNMRDKLMANMLAQQRNKMDAVWAAKDAKDI